MSNSIAFISDIHGNYPALKAVLEDIARQGIFQIYCLGDLVGYYCQINEVIDEIRKKCIATCIGNHDFAMINNNGVIARSKTCTNMLTSQLRFITGENYNYLKHLPTRLEINQNDFRLLCVHGGLIDNVDEYTNSTIINDDYVKSIEGQYDYLLTAHTHIPSKKKLKTIQYCNIGSVGQPRNGDSRASYATITSNGLLELHKVEYDIDSIVDAMRKQGYPNYISEILYRGEKIGGGNFFSNSKTIIEDDSI